VPAQVTQTPSISAQSDEPALIAAAKPAMQWTSRGAVLALVILMAAPTAER
jgi:hypothetical protein